MCTICVPRGISKQSVHYMTILVKAIDNWKCRLKTHCIQLVNRAKVCKYGLSYMALLAIHWPNIHIVFLEIKNYSINDHSSVGNMK